jgi:putative acetyltransferase
MNVRLYQLRDTAGLARLFTATVRSINIAHYSPEQVLAWAPDRPDLVAWHCEFAKLICFVCELDSEILGFISFKPDGKLEHLYVHAHLQRQGVASALFRRLEEEAISRGIHRIFTEASITARPFFERVGFRVIAPQEVKCRGVSFINYQMERLIT